MPLDASLCPLAEKNPRDILRQLAQTRLRSLLRRLRCVPEELRWRKKELRGEKKIHYSLINMWLNGAKHI